MRDRIISGEVPHDSEAHSPEVLNGWLFYGLEPEAAAAAEQALCTLTGAL